MDGVKMKARAAISEHLPVSVLLGTDLKELSSLLRVNPSVTHSEDVADVMAVTRAQAKENEREEAARVAKERASGVRPTAVQEEDELVELESQELDADDGERMIGGSFADDLFTPVRTKCKSSRKQKREARHKHGLVRAKDHSTKKNPTSTQWWDLGISRARLQQLQESDESLGVLRSLAEEESTSGAVSLFWKDGLLYRRWKPRKSQEEDWIDQIVLPRECRRGVLHLAHMVPMGGHLGRKKTTARIQRRFFRSTLRRDVGDFCRSCEACQHVKQQPVPRVPMVPIPPVSVPFHRIAMNIVGPLPRSRSGNRFVLVVCDYATRYPEAILLKTIDAEKIAEELVHFFSRVGIPKEILTDQGPNFQSQLLGELYRLLHVEALRTSPYHHQTDGLVEQDAEADAEKSGSK